MLNKNKMSIHSFAKAKQLKAKAEKKKKRNAVDNEERKDIPLIPWCLSRKQQGC